MAYTETEENLEAWGRELYKNYYPTIRGEDYSVTTVVGRCWI